MGYSRKYHSEFPTTPIPVGTKQDINDSVKELVSQYYAYIDDGNIAGANQLYETNKDTLDSYIVNSAYFNRLEEEIYNIGVALIEKLAYIVSDTEPTEQSVDSYWLEDY